METAPLALEVVHLAGSLTGAAGSLALAGAAAGSAGALLERRPRRRLHAAAPPGRPPSPTPIAAAMARVNRVPRRVMASSPAPCSQRASWRADLLRPRRPDDLASRQARLGVEPVDDVRPEGGVEVVPLGGGEGRQRLSRRASRERRPPRPPRAPRGTERPSRPGTRPRRSRAPRPSRARPASAPPRRWRSRRRPPARRAVRTSACGRVEQRTLVLLQVAVVRERQALHDREQRHEVADGTPGPAARQLGDVGVLLLRHERAAGGEGVGERHEAELAAWSRGPSPRRGARGAPPRARRRRPARWRCRGRTRRRASSGSRRRGRACAPRAPGRAGASSRRARRRRAATRRRGACTSAKRLAIAIEGLDVGEQVVREGDRLRSL